MLALCRRHNRSRDRYMQRRMGRKAMELQDFVKVAQGVAETPARLRLYPEFVQRVLH